MTDRAKSGFSLALQVLRSEGLAAFRDRLNDRLAAGRRGRSFRSVAVDDRSTDPGPLPALAEVPMLNVLSTPPRPDFGGVQVQLLRRLAAEGRQRSWALLYPADGGYRLEISSPEGLLAVVLRARVPVPNQLREVEFEWAVRTAAARVGARTVHFEQLVGWPLASIADLRQEGLRLVVSIHDFGLFCLRPHLVERPVMRFCDYSRDAARCARCLRCDWSVEDDFQERRRAQAAALLGAAEAVIYPSDFLRRTYRDLIPDLDPTRQRVVEPPTLGEASKEFRPRRPRQDSTVTHIAYVGSVKAHKGALLFEKLVHDLESSKVRWTVYGGGDEEILRRLRRLPRVRVRGYYRADRLPEMLARERVDLALLLSIWPEAYALTFDECLRAGVPALAFDHGAIADRLRRCGGGALIPLDAGAAGVVRVLNQVLSDPAQASEAAITPINEELALPDGRSAAEAMLEIYRQLDLGHHCGGD